MQRIQKVRKYAELTELTPYAAHELIKAIICYDLIGIIPRSELMELEMA